MDIPSLSTRVKALLIDIVVLLILWYYSPSFFNALEQLPEAARRPAALYVPLLYDPLLVSLYGGTIGHQLYGIRVKRINDPNRNILFPLALIRYVIKIPLGWPSLFLASRNPQRRTLHDQVAGSVIVTAAQASSPGEDRTHTP